MTRKPYMCVPNWAAAFCRSYKIRCWCATNFVLSPRMRQAMHALWRGLWADYAGGIGVAPPTPTIQCSFAILGLLDSWSRHSIFSLAGFGALATCFPWQYPIQRPVLLHFLQRRFCFFLARAPFGPGGLVAECIEPYLYSAVDSRPGPGGSRTTASCPRPGGQGRYRFATASVQRRFCWSGNLPTQQQSLQMFVQLCCDTPANHGINGPAVGWLFYFQPVIDYINHCSRNGNVNPRFESQTANSGIPNGVLYHSLCSEVFNGSPLVVVKGLHIVVCDHETYTAHGVSRKCFFFMFAFPVPLIPTFLLVKEPRLSGFKIGHTHPSEVVYNGLRHPDGGKEVQIANAHLDWAGSTNLLSFILAHTPHQPNDRPCETPLPIQHHSLM